MASLLLLGKEDMTGEEFVVLTESNDPKEHQEWIDPGYRIVAAITIHEDVQGWPTDRLWQVT